MIVGFHLVDGEAFIGDTPVKLLVERAREKGWVQGPRPTDNFTFQQATARAGEDGPTRDPVVKPPPPASPGLN